MRTQAWLAVGAWGLLAGLTVVSMRFVPWPVAVFVFALIVLIAGLGRVMVTDAVNGIWLRRDITLRPSHYIRIEGPRDVEGYVTRIGFRHVQLQTSAGDIIRIPNTTLANSIFTNFHLPYGKDTILLDIEAAAEPSNVTPLLEQEARLVALSVPGIVAGSQQIKTLPGRFPGCRRYVLRCQARNEAYRDQLQDLLRHRVLTRFAANRISVPTLSPARQDKP